MVQFLFLSGHILQGTTSQAMRSAVCTCRQHEVEERHKSGAAPGADCMCLPAKTVRAPVVAACCVSIVSSACLVDEFPFMSACRDLNLRTKNMLEECQNIRTAGAIH